jgi:hypothetical protein
MRREIDMEITVVRGVEGVKKRTAHPSQCEKAICGTKCARCG